MKRKSSIIVSTMILLAGVLTGCSSGDDGKISNNSDDIKSISVSDAKAELKSYVKKIAPTSASLIRDIDGGSIDDKGELPPIDTSYPLVV